MRRWRWLKRLGLGLLAVAAVLVAANWTHLRAFPGVLPAFYAKEFCSCRYVMGRDEAHCHGYARQWLPISAFALDEAVRRVTVHGTGVTRSARWQGVGEGCRLED